MTNDISKTDEKRKKNRDRQRRFRDKYKAAGLKEVRIWIPEDGEFLLQILASQLRDKSFYMRPTDDQIEFAKEIIAELNEPIPEEAVRSKQAMARWIKGTKKRFYDAKNGNEDRLKQELEMLGLDLSKAKEAAKEAAPKPRKRVLKGTKRPWVKSSLSS